MEVSNNRRPLLEETAVRRTLANSAEGTWGSRAVTVTAAQARIGHISVPSPATKVPRPATRMGMVWLSMAWYDMVRYGKVSYSRILWEGSYGPERVVRGIVRMSLTRIYFECH